MVALTVAASTVHPISTTTAMASHKATREIEEEVVAALTEAEVAEDQEDSTVAATEAALAAEAMITIVAATTGTTMMMTVTATKVAGGHHSPKWLRAASIKSHVEVVTLPNTLEREVEACEVAHPAETLTVIAPKLPSQPLQTPSQATKEDSRKEAANHSKLTKQRLPKAQAKSL